ncbi:MAG: S-layer homology domain-containing protein [Anaerovoracaceae bacterium]|jgi:uncharacterized repeat protein (TIGR02543 family)
MKRKFISVFLVLCMVLAFMPATFAADTGGYIFSIDGVEDQMAVGVWDNDAAATLTGTTGAQAYSNALILITVTGPDGANPQIIANDGTNDYNLAETGAWGPSTGFAVSETTNNVTPLKLCFDKVGEYTATFKLVDVSNDNAVITEGSKTINVVVPAVNGVSVVDGTDGYTPVTRPVAGQKLTANIDTNVGTIGSYPVNANAHYTWHYEGSDAVLGTDPVYTVTSDNVGKVLCVDVTVDGYNGNATWKASDATAAGYTITLDPNGGTVSPATMTTVDNKLSGSLPLAIRGGYIFDGWFTAAKGGTQITADTVFTGDTTIYAQWSAISNPAVSKYTLTFETNGGSDVKAVTKAENSVIDLSEYTTTKEGYTFEGWYSDADLTQKVTSVTLNADTTVYAKWTENNENPFADVNTDDYFYDAVMWAVGNGITEGTSETTFSPDASCTRAEMVTLLWRASGSPEANAENPFTDVSSDAYYYDAVMWAVENGITVGTSETTFSPDLVVTRGQAVTFLYRQAGSPAVSGNSFTDVDSDDYYADAVSWAASENITVGTGDNKFSPEADCTRAQIVSFMYRQAK